VSESLLLDVGVAAAPAARAVALRPVMPAEPYRVADDLRRPLTEVVAVAEQEAAAFGAGDLGCGYGTHDCPACSIQLPHDQA